MASGDSSYDVELVKLPALKASVRDLAAFCHLIGMATFLGIPVFVPLVVWLTRRRTAPFAARHAKEALNFQTNILLAALLALGAGRFLDAWLPQALAVSFIGTGVVLAYGAAMAIYAGRVADQGRYYRYPGILRLVP